MELVRKWITYLWCPEQVLLFVVALHKNKSETYTRVRDRVSDRNSKVVMGSSYWVQAGWRVKLKRCRWLVWRRCRPSSWIYAQTI